MVVSGLMVAAYSRALRRIDVDRDVTLDLLSGVMAYNELAATT